MKQTLLLFLLLSSALRVFAQDATLIYKNTVNSTVTIETEDGLGSGFFVGENIIATNYHVIKGDTGAYCYTNNSDIKYKIEGYVAVDTAVDLILLKVSGLKRTPIRLSPTPVEIGQKIYVIGSPKGLPATISDGIVSALRDFDGYKLIQITAAISPGSSGGPVLNSKGELIGVSVASLKEGQNLNFAIPKAKLKILLNNRNINSLSLGQLAFDNEIVKNDEIPNNSNRDNSDATKEETIDWITGELKEYIITPPVNHEEHASFYLDYQESMIVDGSLICLIRDMTTKNIFDGTNDEQYITDCFDFNKLSNYSLYPNIETYSNLTLSCNECVTHKSHYKGEDDKISSNGGYIRVSLKIDDSMVKRLTKALEHLKRLTLNTKGKF